MSREKSRRLTNTKTKRESGYDHVVSCLEIETPFGKKALKSSRTFYPGEEDELRAELDKVQKLFEFAKEDKKTLSLLSEHFMCMKDIENTLMRSTGVNLSVVEIFDVKSLLFYASEIGKLLEGTGIDDEFFPMIPEDLVSLLDPRNDRTNTFYLYDEYSKELAELRSERRGLELERRKIQKARKESILKNYGIALTPKFDIVIPKTSEDIEKARQIEDLEAIAEDYSSVTFALTRNEEVYALFKRGEEIETQIEEEETKVRRVLSKAIGKKKDILLDNCRRIGRLDLLLAKAKFAIKRNCVKPEILDEHIIQIEEGRQLQMEEIIRAKGKDYTPVTMTLGEGVTCITGANMGGKTISLKLSGLVPLLAQKGFFVPCKKARVGLSNNVRILIGDSQSMERGLSSFGSEMEELKEILDQAKDRSLILIDEIASGTNPVEGLALTKSLVEYFIKRPYITLITTHYEGVTEEEGVRNLQVRGLAGANFTLLDKELRRANRKERIEIIGRYMDYRLEEVSRDKEVPKDALNIAKMLGIDKEIIEGAKKYIKSS